MAGESIRLFVFVTGPYSAPTPEGEARNIQRAIDVGRAVFENGYSAQGDNIRINGFSDSCFLMAWTRA